MLAFGLSALMFRYQNVPSESINWLRFMRLPIHCGFLQISWAAERWLIVCVPPNEYAFSTKLLNTYSQHSRQMEYSSVQSHGCAKTCFPQQLKTIYGSYALRRNHVHYLNRFLSVPHIRYRAVAWDLNILKIFYSRDSNPRVKVMRLLEVSEVTGQKPYKSRIIEVVRTKTLS